MRLVLLLVLMLVLAGSTNAAELRVVTLSPAEDLALPFWCDWGYDWDERCYWDDSDRLGVGGVDDKVWRAGLRFSLAALPAGAIVSAAELSLSYDRVCVAPLRTTRPCDGRGYAIDAHPIYTSRWRSEREVEFGPRVAAAYLEQGAPPTRLVWDVTEVVADWRSGALANSGVLLKLADGEEDYGSSGPAFPSSSYRDASLRPTLTIWYLA